MKHEFYKVVKAAHRDWEQKWAVYNNQEIKEYRGVGWVPFYEGAEFGAKFIWKQYCRAKKSADKNFELKLKEILEDMSR